MTNSRSFCTFHSKRTKILSIFVPNQNLIMLEKSINSWSFFSQINPECIRGHLLGGLQIIVNYKMPSSFFPLSHKRARSVKLSHQLTTSFSRRDDYLKFALLKCLSRPFNKLQVITFHPPKVQKLIEAKQIFSKAS